MTPSGSRQDYGLPATQLDAQTSPAPSTHASTSSSSLGSHESRYAPPPRDYEAAFASLSTSYGFSQGHLHVPTKNPKTKKVKAKKDNKDGKGKARDDTADTPNTSPSQSPTTSVGEQGKGSPSTL